MHSLLCSKQLQAEITREQGPAVGFEFYFLTFAHEGLEMFGLPPSFLFKTRAASMAFGTAGIVLATTEEDSGGLGVLTVTSVGVAITHATTSYAYIFDRVEIL